MNEPIPCTICQRTDLHQHPLVSEGWFGASETGSPEDRGHGMVRVGDTLTLQTIPLKCGLCGKAWEGPAFTPLSKGQTHRMRTCDTCQDRVVAEAEKRHKAKYPPKNAPSATYRHAAPLRLPHAND